MKARRCIIILFTALFACSKETPLILDGALTNCATCTYKYYDNADYNSTNQLEAGNYRVFKYQMGSENTCGPSSAVFFKAPLYEDQFVIDSAQIAAGKVSAYYFSCPCCEDFAYIPTNPIGGQIKARRTGNKTWLVNATVILGYQNRPIDTIVVNQYFTQSSI